MTSPSPKPFTVTVFASAGTSSVASGSTGASVVSGSAAASSSSVIAGASSAALMASTAAVEVIVALATASMPSPSVNGPLLPMNCAVNSSPAQRVPRPSVCVLASMVSAEIVPSSLSVRRATTSPPAKPDAVPWCTSPVSTTGSAAAVSCFAPKDSGSPSTSLPRTWLMHFSTLLEAVSTAFEVMVAPEIASMVSPPYALTPLNCSARSASCQRAPKPAVSEKFVSPIWAPVTFPSTSTPSVTATSPP